MDVKNEVTQLPVAAAPKKECTWCKKAALVAGGVTVVAAGAAGGYALGRKKKAAPEYSVASRL